MVKSKEKSGKSHTRHHEDAPSPQETHREETSGPAGAEGAASEPTEGLLKKLEEKEREAAANYEKYLRAVADLDNYKKRAGREHTDLVKYGNEKLLRDLLPILDSLDRALKQKNEETAELRPFIEGLKLIETQFLNCLQKHGVEKIESRGQDFDPSVHQALMQVQSEEFEDGKIIEEFETGYLLNGRLLKPAKVSVSKRISRSVETPEQE